MLQCFKKDDRLGILIPQLDKEWKHYSIQEQGQIIAEWEKIRGHIPDRMKELETVINKKQARLEIEENFEISCQLNSEIADLASVINDLWLWYRIDQTVTDRKLHA